jgi:hypothetical protein
VDVSKPDRRGADRRRALWHLAAALTCLIAGVLAGRLLGSDTVVWIAAVAGYLSLGCFLHRALVLWDIDSPMRHDPREQPTGSSRFPNSLRDFRAGSQGLE